MAFLDSSTFQNVISLNIKNVTNNDLNSWCLQNNICDETRLYIKDIIDVNNETDDDNDIIDCIYLQNDLVIAVEYKTHNFNLLFNDILIEQVKKIPVIANIEAKKYIDLFMNNLMKNNKWDMKETYFLNLLQYQEKSIESDFTILNQTIAFDVSEFNLRLQIIIGSNKYRPVYCELKRLYPEMKILPNFIVQEMYYYNKTAIAFSGKLIGTDFKQWFWADELTDSLRYLKPQFLIIPITELDINTILDKISKYGSSSLTASEIKFLENIKQ